MTCAKGTSASTFGDVFGSLRLQGYIRRHLWQRSRLFSAPRVHPPAPLETFSALFGTKGTSAGTFGNVLGSFRRQGSIRQHLWQRSRLFSAPRVHLAAPLETFSVIFDARGTSVGTFGSVSGAYRRQGYIWQHLWLRFRRLSAPRVHPPAPLATFSALFGSNGTFIGTFSNVLGSFRLQGYIRRHLWRRFR